MHKSTTLSTFSLVLIIPYPISLYSRRKSFRSVNSWALTVLMIEAAKALGGVQPSLPCSGELSTYSKPKLRTSTTVILEFQSIWSLQMTKTGRATYVRSNRLAIAEKYKLPEKPEHFCITHFGTGKEHSVQSWDPSIFQEPLPRWLPLAYTESRLQWPQWSLQRLAEML